MGPPKSTLPPLSIIVVHDLQGSYLFWLLFSGAYELDSFCRNSIALAALLSPGVTVIVIMMIRLSLLLSHFYTLDFGRNDQMKPKKKAKSPDQLDYNGIVELEECKSQVYQEKQNSEVSLLFFYLEINKPKTIDLCIGAPPLLVIQVHSYPQKQKLQHLFFFLKSKKDVTSKFNRNVNSRENLGLFYGLVPSFFLILSSSSPYLLLVC